MTLADATPSLPDWRHYTKRITSSRKRRFVCHIITSSRGNELHALLQNLRSDEDFSECSRATWYLSKNHNARNKPPTSYYYGIQFYFLKTSLSATFIRVLNMLTSWLETFLRKETSAKYSGDSRGYKIESHDMLLSVGKSESRIRQDASHMRFCTSYFAFPNLKLS